MTKRLIGLYQLITGIFGVILLLYSAYSKGSAALRSQSFLILIIVGVLLYGLLAWSGYGLLNNLKNARRYSMLLQAFQVPFVGISGILYKFSAAGFIYLGLKNGKFVFDLSVQPINFEISANAANNSVFMLCLIPAVLLYGLSKVK